MEHLKKFGSWILKQLKRFWNWLLGKTTIDEKIEDVVEEIKERKKLYLKLQIKLKMLLMLPKGKNEEADLRKNNHFN